MKKRLMKATLLTPMLLVLFFACAGDAFGRFNPESLYNITAMHTGKCLDVYGWGQGDGEKIHEFNCVEGALNQQWSIIPVGDGSEYYRIIVKHSGKALDVNGGIFTFWDGVPVKQWTYWGIANQMWKLIPVPLSPDVYQIVARHSGKSLEINVGPGPRENLGIAQQSTYRRRPNQQFKVMALPSANCQTDQIGSRLIGSSELTVTRVSNDPFRQPANLTIDVTQCRGIVGIARFEPTTTAPYMTLFGLNTTTVSLLRGGSGSISSARNISVQITLHLEQSLAMSRNPIIAAAGAPSDLTLTLTGTVAPNGEVTLTGSGTFVGGYLNGSYGSLRVTGRIAPSP